MPDPMSVIRIPLSGILDLLRDRKDRTTKAYLEHETRLAADIKVAGVRNPLKGFWVGDKLQLTCGQTRKNAAIRAGLSEVPVIVLEGEITPTRLLIEELTDNNMQEGFDVLTQAEIYVELMQQNNWTPAELCRNVQAAKPGSVSKALSIFENLIEEMKVKLRSGEIGPRVAYHLSRLSAEQQREAWPKVAHMKADAIEDYVIRILGGGKQQKKAKPLKFKMGGIQMTVTNPTVEIILSFAEQLMAAGKKLVKDGDGVEFLPSRLRA